MQYKKFLPLFLIFPFLFLLLNFFTGGEKKDQLIGAIHKCNSVSKELRFSCYRSSLQKYYDGNFDTFLQKINGEDFNFENKESSYAIFGTNCHTFYHAVGDFIATNSNKDLESKLNYCSEACTSGCMMGLYKRTALKEGYSQNLLEQFFSICRKGELHQCTHEIGHILDDKYTSSILQVIDSLSSKDYHLEQPQKYKYATFQKPDLNKPFDDCKTLLPESEWQYCYTGIGHNLFLFSEFSEDGYKSEFSNCMKVDKKNLDNCYAFLIYRIGINDAAPRYLSGAYSDGIQVCDNVVNSIDRKDLEIRCFRGIGAGIGLFVETEYPGYNFNSLTADDKKQILAYGNLCEKVPENFKDDCYTGLLGSDFNFLYKVINPSQKNQRIETLLKQIDSTASIDTEQIQIQEDNGFFSK